MTHATKTWRCLPLAALVVCGLPFMGRALPPVLDWRPLDLHAPDRRHEALWFAFIQAGERRAHLPADVDRPDIHPVGDYFPRIPVSGEGFRLIAPRAFARPGDRWVEVFVAIDTDATSPETPRLLDVSLFAPGENQPTASRRIDPSADAGVLRIDLRRPGLEQARLQVVLNSGSRRMGVAEMPLSAQPPAQPLQPGDRIPVAVDVPEGIAPDTAVPLTFGAPFPAGALWTPDRVRLVDDTGRDVPFQAEVAGRWAEDGAIKWLRIDTIAVPREGLHLAVGGDPHPAAPPANPLRVETSDDGVVTLHAGATRYRLGGAVSPIAEIRQDDRLVATTEGTRGLYVVDQQGRLGVASAAAQTLVVESAGPLAASVRMEGDYLTPEGEAIARHVTRVEAFAGRDEARVTHTLVLTRDTNEVWFRDIGWEWDVMPGTAPEAHFGIAHDDPDAMLTHPLTDAESVAWILQAAHLRFNAGTNRFAVGAVSGADPAETLLLEGTEMGDWAALRGEAGGLMAAVRDAALQHPKEFELRPDRLNIRLFSPRADEELDFRAGTLAEKWHLPEIYTDPQGREHAVRETVAAHESNAIGWAKTHDLLLTPLSPESPDAPMLQLARLHAGRVYGHVDPHWIYTSGAMGPLHPRDRDQNPGAENTVDRLMETFGNLLRGRAFFGFVDYNAGPSFSHRASTQLVRERRFGATYQLRPDLWKLYARSGDRAFRSFAEQSTRAFSDNYMAHWDGAGKRRGLFIEGSMSGASPHLGTGDLPFYWEGRTVFNFEYHGDAMSLNHVLYDYYLSGYRRAGDVARQYAEALKRDWTPETAARYVRLPMTYRGLLHAYHLTLDPELRAMAEATLSMLYDPEGVTAMTKNKQLGATYKARCAVRVLIEGWDTFGMPMHYDMARRLSQHKWFRFLPLGGTTSPFGIIGNFLYRETGSLEYAQWLDFFLRHAAVRQVSTGPFRAADISSGIAQAQDAMTRFDPETRRRVAWAAYQDEASSLPLRIAVSKGAYDRLDLSFTSKAPRASGSVAWVQPLDPAAFWVSRDRSLIDMQASSNLGPNPHGHVTLRVRIPKEAPGEAYAIRPQHHGRHYVTATITPPEILQLSPPTRRWTQPYAWQGQVSMVLCAPEGFQTLSGPPDARVFFNLPEGVSDPRIQVSASAEVFAPDGRPYAEAPLPAGWHALPADETGLWSVRPADAPITLRLHNLPPFFAFDDPIHYFAPPIPWVEWLSPTDDKLTAGEPVSIAFRLHSSGEAAPERVEVYLGETRLHDGPEAPEALLLEPKGLAPGAQTLRVVAHGETGSETLTRVLTWGAE